MTDTASIDQLAQAAEKLQARVHKLQLVVNREDSHLAHVAKAFLRAVIVQARAVAMLGHTPIAEATYSNARTAMELWSDLRLLLLPNEITERRRLAQWAVLFGYEQALAAHERTGFAKDEVEPVRQAFDEVSSSDPEGFSLYEARRIGKKNHWSGRQRTEILREIENRDQREGALRELYRILSWNSHGSVFGALNTRTVVEDGKALEVHAHYMEPQEAAEFCANICLQFMSDSWQHYSDAFLKSSA